MSAIQILSYVIGAIVLLALLLLYQARQTPPAGGHPPHEAPHQHQDKPVAPAKPPVAAPKLAAAQPAPALKPSTPPPAPAQPAPAPAPAPVPVQPDNLEIIEGIGPKIKEILNQAGILTFRQLASSDPARLKQTLEAAGLRLGDPASWPEQAKLAAEGKMEDLQKLQDQLKGGRKVT